MKTVLRPTYCILILLAVLSIMPNQGYALTDTIHGIINICTPVIAIDSCNATLVVEKSLGFKANDRVILIQMQGATISVADDSTYGNLVSLGSAGNYELTTVERVIGKTVQLKYRLERPYDVKGSVQLVRVPHYTGNVVVDDTLTAPKWDGKCGGVLALIVDSALTLEGLVTVESCGFRGGYFGAAGDSSDQTGFDYAPSSGRSGIKGESVVSKSVNTRAGRGKRASGGGGGNGYHSGGGGGSNAGAGGRGGNQYDTVYSGPDWIGGTGGVQLTDTTVPDKLFLGGGGGSGHQSGHYESGIAGANGSGIVFVRSHYIDTYSGFGIWSIGGTPANVTNSAGAGGGGGGGSILIDADSVRGDTSLPVAISVVGGHGGNIGSNATMNNSCRGPGGGGSGGRILLTFGLLVVGGHPEISYQFAGGFFGEVIQGVSACSGGMEQYGADNGVNGYVKLNVMIVEGNVPR